MIQTINSVKGIKCWGAHSGVKSMRRDLAIIYSEVPASAAATFTQNQVVAEPLKISKKHIANGKSQVIVVNAGNANACTGEQGRKGAEAKGSGMIHPNMATMLAFIVSDVAISPELLDRTVKAAVNKSFNMITVDGDTSTNDMCVVLCNGMAGNEELRSKKDKGYRQFQEKLEELMIHLAQLIVSDGEGSSKFIEYQVSHAPDEATARKLVRAISGSTLVKAAMYGRDPNWGRIICAAGNCGVPFDYEKIDLYLGDNSNPVKVLENGRPQDFDRNFIKKLLRESRIRVHLDLKNGKAQATGWGSDLTTDYVLFNSVYTT